MKKNTHTSKYTHPVIVHIPHLYFHIARSGMLRKSGLSKGGVSLKVSICCVWESGTLSTIMELSQYNLREETYFMFNAVEFWMKRASVYHCA